MQLKLNDLLNVSFRMWVCIIFRSALKLHMVIFIWQQLR